MKNDILPIGSIVTAAGQDIMICAYINKGSLINNEQYDYACCLYPNGMSKDAILIKKEQIQRVKFVGFQDGRFVEFKNKLRDKNETDAS